MTDADVQRLQEIRAALPNEDCDGCDGCGTKCAGEIPMTRWEFAEVRAYLAAHPLAQEATESPGTACVFDPPCRFRDDARGRCRIYPVRPLICRLFGLVEWLPCPLHRWGVRVPEGWAIIAWYSSLERRPYHAWLAERENAER
jgi:hypothetical protein